MCYKMQVVQILSMWKLLAIQPVTSRTQRLPQDHGDQSIDDFNEIKLLISSSELADPRVDFLKCKFDYFCQWN